MRKTKLTIWQVIVNGVVLATQLGEEQPSQIRNPLVLVLHTLGHLSQLALDLDHSVQDQVSQHHQGVLLDGHTGIVQSLVQFGTVFVDDVVEGDCNITKGDDDVAADAGVLRGFENLE